MQPWGEAKTAHRICDAKSLPTFADRLLRRYVIVSVNQHNLIAVFHHFLAVGESNKHLCAVVLHHNSLALTGNRHQKRATATYNL